LGKTEKADEQIAHKPGDFGILASIGGIDRVCDQSSFFGLRGLSLDKNTVSNSVVFSQEDMTVLENRFVRFFFSNASERSELPKEASFRKRQ
jgi:hypothetical protein